MPDQIFAVDPTILLRRATEVVAAYVSHNSVPMDELGRLISDVHAALSGTATPLMSDTVVERQKPAVSIRKSLQDDYLTCLDCGNSFKSLKRHLMTHHAITPEDYRAKWDLPRDYPMVAPNYAEARSILAKEMGLGQSDKRIRRSVKTEH